VAFNSVREWMKANLFFNPYRMNYTAE